MSQRWYSIREAAERLGVSHDTVSRLVDRGELPAIRVSKRLVRIPVPAFDVYASSRSPRRRSVVRRPVGASEPIASDEAVRDPQPV